jgi:hypothetical protein
VVFVLPPPPLPPPPPGGFFAAKAEDEPRTNVSASVMATWAASGERCIRVFMSFLPFYWHTICAMAPTQRRPSTIAFCTRHESGTGSPGMILMLAKRRARGAGKQPCSSSTLIRGGMSSTRRGSGGRRQPHLRNSLSIHHKQNNDEQRCHTRSNLVGARPSECPHRCAVASRCALRRKFSSDRSKRVRNRPRSGLAGCQSYACARNEPKFEPFYCRSRAFRWLMLGSPIASGYSHHYARSWA